jgi:hypothetical protein
MRGSRAGLTPHPMESPELATAYKNVAAGATLRAETKRLTAEGFPVRNLRDVLLSARNAGLVAHHGRIVAEATNPAAIIDPDTFNTVAVILNDPTRRTSPGRPANTILGGGLLVCGKCGGNLAAGRKRQQGTYKCIKCHGVSRIRARIDEPVLKRVGDLIVALAANGDLHLPATEDHHVDELRESVSADEDRLDALAALMASGDLDPSDYAKSAGRIRANLTTATKALAKRANRPALADLGNDPLTAWNQRKDDANNGDIGWIRAALREVIESIVLDADKMLTINWLPWVGPWPNMFCVAETVTPTAERRQLVKELTLEGVTGIELARQLKVNRATIVKDLRILRSEGQLS